MWWMTAKAWMPSGGFSAGITENPIGAGKIGLRKLDLQAGMVQVAHAPASLA